LFSTIRKRATYANIVATLALFLALGGGAAYAAKHYIITSKKQIAPAVLHKLKGKPGATGPAGAPGAPGAPGAAGSARAYATVIVNGVNNPTLETNVGLTTVTEPETGVFCVGPIVPGHPILVSPIATVAAIAPVSPQKCPGNFQIDSNEPLSGGEGFSVVIP
jgi:hypothetical protein